MSEAAWDRKREGERNRGGEQWILARSTAQNMTLASSNRPLHLPRSIHRAGLILTKYFAIFSRAYLVISSRRIGETSENALLVLAFLFFFRFLPFLLSFSFLPFFFVCKDGENCDGGEQQKLNGATRDRNQRLRLQSRRSSIGREPFLRPKFILTK